MRQISERLLFNENAKKTLGALFANGRVPHAILLEGPENCGKTVCANEIAARILCVGENPPCGSCISCRKTVQGNHPDIVTVQKEAGKQQFSVELVRTMRDEAYIMPNESRYKVFIVRNAHEMNANAQNALLKILEEPPVHCVFILTAVSRTRLLPTIMSRVVTVGLSHPSVQECFEVLPQLVPNKTQDDYLRAAQISDGSISMAAQVLEDGHRLEVWSKALELAEAAVMKSEYELLMLLATVEKDRELMLEVLADVKQILAWLLLCKKGCCVSDKKYAELAAKITALQVVKFVDIIEWAQSLARQNVSASVLLSSVCAKLKNAAQE